MKRQPQLAEQLIEPFEPDLLNMLECRPLLDAGMAYLLEQRIDYGTTDAATTLIGRDKLTIEEQHQAFFLSVFYAGVRLAIGQRDSVDTARYVRRVVEPTVTAKVAERVQTFARHERGARFQRGQRSGSQVVNQTRTAESAAASISAGIDTLIDSIPDAVSRMRLISEQASIVVPAVKAEIAGDPAKEYMMLKLLTSDLGSREIPGFQDPGLTLATFFGIADIDTEADKTVTEIELTEKLHDGYFDYLIAAEMIDAAIEKAADGDRLTDEESAMVLMIDQSRFYSGDDEQRIIAKFSTPEGIEQWRSDSRYLLMSRREWFVRSLAANGDRIQNLIYENYLGTVPIGQVEFTQTVSDAIEKNFSVSNLSRTDQERANQLRARAEIVQREKRKRLLTRTLGDAAMSGNAEVVSVAERPLRYLHHNGIDGQYQADDEPGPILAGYLDIYNGDPVLQADLQRSIDYLRKLSPTEMARLLAQGRGLKTMGGQQLRIDGKKHSIHRMSPNRLPGLHTDSPSAQEMRLMFVQLRNGGLGVLGVTRADRMARFAK